jgi:hypothetical protein
MSTDIRYIDIDCEGETTGKRYVGQFEIKLFLTLKDRAEAGRLRNKLLKDIAENDDVYFMLQLLSNLNTHMAGKKPDWFGEDGTDLEDTQPIIALATGLREAQTREMEARKPKEKK